MKTAIYIEGALVQLVLTPESDFERNAVRSFAKKPLKVQTFEGYFHISQGGYIRQFEPEPMSLMLLIDESTDTSKGVE